jgi:hypothetical protein
VIVKKMMALAFAVAVLTVLTIAAEVPEGTEVLELESKIGTVTFQHATHAGFAECSDCHHMWDGEGKPDQCSSCHKGKEGDDGSPKLMDAAHQTCGDCHQEKKDAGEKSGPLTDMKSRQCKDCHVRG